MLNFHLLTGLFFNSWDYPFSSCSFVWKKFTKQKIARTDIVVRQPCEENKTKMLTYELCPKQTKQFSEEKKGNPPLATTPWLEKDKYAGQHDLHNTHNSKKKWLRRVKPKIN